jgi:pyruvate/2-oxoglutarate dehydrogenase complex dihydrolipoamide acyltransferase (E2) component
VGKLNLTKLTNTSPFRKVAMGTWRGVKDPTVYGLLEIDMKAVNDLLPAYSAKEGVKITASHLVGKATAYCMKRRPEINSMIRGSQIYLREDVTLFYQVNIPGDDKDKVKKATLSGCTIEKAENLSAAGIAKDMQEKVHKIKSKQDKVFKKNMDVIKLLPWCIVGYFLDFISWLNYGLNLNLSLLGVPKDPFGSVMITNVGSLGIDMAWAPLCHYTRVPLLLTICAMTDKAVVIDGNIEVRPILPITITFDHRVIDGVHASQMAKDFKECFADPEKYLF